MSARLVGREMNWGPFALEYPSARSLVVRVAGHIAHISVHAYVWSYIYTSTCTLLTCIFVLEEVPPVCPLPGHTFNYFQGDMYVALATVELAYESSARGYKAG